MSVVRPGWGGMILIENKFVWTIPELSVWFRGVQLKALPGSDLDEIPYVKLGQHLCIRLKDVDVPGEWGGRPFRNHKVLLVVDHGVTPSRCSVTPYTMVGRTTFSTDGVRSHRFTPIGLSRSLPPGVDYRRALPFEQAIADTPDDSALKLLYADWLEERDASPELLVSLRGLVL